VIVIPSNVDKDAEMVFAVLDGGATLKYLQTSNHYSIKRIYDNIRWYCKNMTECFNEVKKANEDAKGFPVALIGEQPTLQTFINLDKDSYVGWKMFYQYLENDLPSGNYGIVLPKGAAKRYGGDGGSIHDVRTVIDYHLSAMKYEGDLTRLKLKHWPDQKRCQ